MVKANHSAVTNGRRASKRRSLMPRTMMRCSTRRNAPCRSRCSMMRAASPSPIPGSRSNSAREAVLIRMRVVACAEEGVGASSDVVRLRTTPARRGNLTHDETHASASA